MTNVIKFQAPFERLKTYNISPEVNLHKAIVLQAIIDASSVNESGAQYKLKQNAYKWIFEDIKNLNSNFNTTVYRANLEPDYIRKIAKEIINLQKNNRQSCIDVLDTIKVDLLKN